MLDYADTSKSKIAIDELGDFWANFEPLLTPEHCNFFNTAYNLIVLSVKECTLSLDITTILTNNTLDTSNMVARVRETLIIYLTDIIMEMGIIVNKEAIDSNSLPKLIIIINTVLSLDDVEDVMGLIYVLENPTFSNEEKFVDIIQRVHDLSDTEDYPDIIADVSSDVIKGLFMGLGGNEDDADHLDSSLTQRIRNNREWLKGTLGGDHIINQGGVGLSFESLTNFYINELALLMPQGPTPYFKAILSLLIISGESSEKLEVMYTGAVDSFSESLTELYDSHALLEEINLDA